jgi:mycothiol system anti-sigma-R factor
MKAECDNAVDYLYQYIDQELTWSRRLRIRWHLKRCGDCMDAYDFEVQLKARIRECGRDDEPPQELFDRIRALIEQEAAGTQDV